MSWLGRLAGQAPPAVFPLCGLGGRDALRDLLASPQICLAQSPRHASLLLVSGHIPAAFDEQVRYVHDQLPHPRATVVLGEPEAGVFASAHSAPDASALRETLTQLQRELMTGARQSEADWGPKNNPVQWQGVGPHGQGGEGMMGGNPYGRSMAMTGPDLRDGLQLDHVQLTLGPFLPWLPPGLRIELELQGDVIQSAKLLPPPRADAARERRRRAESIFEQARSRPVRIAELELARARHQLRASADLLMLLGLTSQAAQLVVLAEKLGSDSSGKSTTSEIDERTIIRLGRKLRRAARWGLQVGGRLSVEAVQPWMGPLSRAAGRPGDARSSDPAYQELDFRPVTQPAGDTFARLAQRLDEAAQSVALARRAADRQRPAGPALEGPRGNLEAFDGACFHALLDECAPGSSFDDFALLLVSLDLDAASIPARDEAEAGDRGEDGGHP